MSEERGWLIEFVAGTRPMWFDGMDFTEDPNGGIRFPSRESAQEIFNLLHRHKKLRLGFSCYAITEHIWPASLPAAEEDAQAAARWRKIENHWYEADIKNNRDGSFKSMTITVKAAQVSDETNRAKLRRAFDAAMSQDSKGEGK